MQSPLHHNCVKYFQLPRSDWSKCQHSKICTIWSNNSYCW